MDLLIYNWCRWHCIDGAEVKEVREREQEQGGASEERAPYTPQPTFDVDICLISTPLATTGNTGPDLTQARQQLVTG